ncbi:MAG: hypothetical protein IKT00_12700 [Prevotella sp.]|nr:hypothetical protein [Prevotella sp.]
MKRFLLTIVAVLTMVLAANAMADMGPRQRRYAPRRHVVQQRYRTPRHYRRAPARFRHQAPPPRYRRHAPPPRYRRHAPPPRYRRHAAPPRHQARRSAPARRRR